MVGWILDYSRLCLCPPQFKMRYSHAPGLEGPSNFDNVGSKVAKEAMLQSCFLTLMWASKVGEQGFQATNAYDLNRGWKAPRIAHARPLRMDPMDGFFLTVSRKIVQISPMASLASDAGHSARAGRKTCSRFSGVPKSGS